MGFADIDKKAASNGAAGSSSVIEFSEGQKNILAKKKGKERERLEKKFLEINRKAAASKTVATAEKKSADADVEEVDDAKVEVLTPGRQSVKVDSPVINLNVPPPSVTYGKQAPTWWQVVGAVKDAALWMVVGGAGWSLFGAKLMGML
jgi:hypothetical protein